MEAPAPAKMGPFMEAPALAPDQDSRESWRYQKELPADRSQLAGAWKLLETYSKIPPDEIEEHVIQVREKAFNIFHYPCIGRWRFLDLYLTSTPQYPSLVARLQAGATLLDVGCCFGHMLRQLAADGAPSANLAGTDLRPEFVQLGYELFRDGPPDGKFAARFVTGDIFGEGGADVLGALDGGFDFVHCASFFHLFGWDGQVRVGVRLVRFFKPGAQAMVLGRQVGTGQPKSLEEYRESGDRRYLHNVESFQALWDVIGEKTGTKWKVTGTLEKFPASLGESEYMILRFAVNKLN